jgi:hypothetical protein
MLKFRLNWASEATNGLVDRPRILQASTPGDGASGSNKENATPGNYFCLHSLINVNKLN